MSSYRVEKHYIKPGGDAWRECDDLTFKAKNLYNQGLYRVRQHYFETGEYLSYNSLQKQLQIEKASCYVELNSKNSQLVLKGLDQNFKAFFAALKSWKKDPSKFEAKPRIPGYKERGGRSPLTFNIQTISGKKLRQRLLKLSGTSFEIPIQQEIRTLNKVNSDKTEYKTLSLKEATIVPKNEGYLIIIKHEVTEPERLRQNGLIAGVDLGVNNLAAISTNVKRTQQLLINGKPLKSINQFYNKKLAELRSELDLCKTVRGRDKLKKKITKLCGKRNHKVEDYLHKSSRMLVSHIVSLGVTHLIVGKNSGWKQEINIGKRNNQNFVNIPHARFTEMLRYKFESLGGLFSETEESYTSKCSFLDREPPKKHESYVGRRIKRGLFKSGEGLKINADTNGSANMIIKVVEDGFDLWSNQDLIEGFVVSPARLTASQHVKCCKQAA